MPRRLGQHFLTDPAILDRIVDALDPRPDDTVIEIGPGQGSLTARLAPRVGRVIAIEKDERLAETVRGERYAVSGGGDRSAANVTVVAGDALTLDWYDLIAARPAHRAPRTAHRARFKVAGNIPYYITSPLIEKALTPPLPEVVVFLVQREVADRLVARPGSKTYGALTAGVQAVAAVERLFVVKRGAFRPPPEVDSAVVRFRPLAEPLVTPGERDAYRRFLSALFSQRRKQLVRSLRVITEWERDQVAARLDAAGFAPTARAEVLAPSQLVELYRQFQR